jgi:uncharacterized protein YjiS (DUF1127 family)
MSQKLGDTSSLEFETHAVEAAHSSTLDGWIDGLSFTGPCENSGSPVGSSLGSEGLESGKDSLQSRSEPDAPQRPVARAMSRLVAFLFESFTACREVMYPGLVDYPSLVDAGKVIDDERPGQRSLHRWLAMDQHENEVPSVSASYLRTSEDFERSAGTRPAFPGRRGSITSRVTRFWSRMRRERQVWLTVRGLAALDNRTLKDIGIHRSQIESAALYRDRYTW